MRTTPSMDAALASDVLTPFLCMLVEFPGTDLALLEAEGEVTFNVSYRNGTTKATKFTGYSNTFGSLQSIDALSDGVGDQAPALSFALLPPGETASALLSQPNMQGSRIRIWLGAIDNASKFVIDAPYLMFEGEIDQPLLTIDNGRRELEFEAVSAFERLFSDEEGIRLSNANHKEVWPGETGLEDVTGVIKQIIWGPGDKITGGQSGQINYGNLGPFGQIARYMKNVPGN